MAFYQVALECLDCGQLREHNIPEGIELWDWYEIGEEPVCLICGGRQYKAVNQATGEVIEDKAK